LGKKILGILQKLIFFPKLFGNFEKKAPSSKQTKILYNSLKGKKLVAQNFKNLKSFKKGSI
jgi:hypothetical protein